MVTELDRAYAVRLPIGRRVAYIRHLRGFTQHDLAGLLGYTKSWVEKIEMGRRDLDRLSVLRKIADVLAVDITLLVTEQIRPGAAHWRHVECDGITPGTTDSPPRTCNVCREWGGNWHQAYPVKHVRIPARIA